MKVMSDLEIAKSELCEENLTLAIVKNGSLLYRNKNHRISGFLDAIEKCGAALEDASVADKVAGKAVALLCAHAKVKEVYASMMSRSALATFKKHKITTHWGELVENILNDDKTGLCPFEKAAERISEPEKALKTFKELRASFKKC